MDTTQINYNQATLTVEQLEAERAAYVSRQAALVSERIDTESAEFVLAEAQAAWEREHGYQAAVGQRRTAAIQLVLWGVHAMGEHGLDSIGDLMDAIGGAMRSSTSLFDLADQMASLEVATAVAK